MIASRERKTRINIPEKKVDAQQSLSDVEDQQYEFDVFLCHNNNDKGIVKLIGNWLKNRKHKGKRIKTWLDDSQLKAGDNLPLELRKNIQKCKSVAVFLGKTGLGPTQAKELQFSCQKRIPIILVLLPGYQSDQKHPPCFEELLWVDYTNTEEDKLCKLLEAIKKTTGY